MNRRQPRRTIVAYVFDLDDTLFDRESAQRLMFQLLLEKHDSLFAGIERQALTNAFYVADNEANQHFESGAPQIDVVTRRIRAFLGLLKLPDDRADEVAHTYLAHYPPDGCAVAGAREVVEKLAHRRRVGLISNGYRKTQQQKLESIGMNGSLSVALFSSELPVRKPQPEIFAMAASQLAVAPDQCLYTGNSYRYDICGAMAAGMKTCWYNPHGRRLIGDQKKPDYEIATLRALVRLR